MTCGKVTGHLYDRYIQLLRYKVPGDALTSLGLTRYCCRQTVLCAVDYVEEINKIERRECTDIQAKTKATDY